MPQEKQQIQDAQAVLFALDIGTRSVIGIVGRVEDGLFRVMDVAVREHAQRAMMDGQIEDIEQVAALAREVKSELEQRQGVSLRQVCVAAAGRALKTLHVTSELELEDGRSVSAQTIYRLEMEAVEQARKQLEEESGDTDFYCVGRSVVRYFLDGYPFPKIKGHKGKRAQAEVIATFLPNEVVDSLYTTMAKAGLTVESMTLEPIAAMNAVIPSELRLLNLALVDVGAGTSDIAISDNGGVAAYAMVTTAGDEITEELIRKYLVDFATAEKMKQTAMDENIQQLRYEDILGFSYAIPRAEALDTLRKAAQGLATAISEKILEVNGKSPTAVFLVGGGSQTPFLRELVAEHLQLDERKVAIGGNNFMKRIVTTDVSLEGPEFATPLGIALTATNDESRESFFLSINGKRMLAFYSRTMTVLDVLLMCGYQYTDLMGRNGKSLSYRLNGEKFLVRGGLYEPSQVLINGQATTLSATVDKEDSITVVPAVAGKDATLCIADALPPQFVLHITVNGQPRVVLPLVLRDGVPVEHRDMVQNGDNLTCDAELTLSIVCAQCGIDLQHSEVFCDGAVMHLNDVISVGAALTVRPLPVVQPKNVVQEVFLPASIPVERVAQTVMPTKVQPVLPHVAEKTVLAESAEQLTLTMDLPAEPALAASKQAAPVVPMGSVAQNPQELDTLHKTVAAEQIVQAAQPMVTQEKQEDAALELVAQSLPYMQKPARGKVLQIRVNDQTYELPPRDTPYQFVDVLNLVDIDFAKPQGNIILQRNGHAASYLELLEEHDDIIIAWEGENDDFQMVSDS